MDPHATPRRLAILAEGHFNPHDGKTARGVIRYGHDVIVAVIDSSRAPGNVREDMGEGFDIPIVASLDEALPRRPDTLLIGIAPTGGRLPDDWRVAIRHAIDQGLDIHSGLHTMLGEDPEFAAAAAARGGSIVDFRRAPDRMATAVGRRHLAGRKVVLTVGTDCAVGKMSVALELTRAAEQAGLASVFVPTGQTGMMIAGWGVAVDRVISDFLNGTCEWLVEEGEALGDWLFVEGQGSLDHPAYSAVTLGLIHGTTPHAMVMVHRVGLERHAFDHLPDVSFPIHPLPDLIRLHEEVAALVAPSVVAAVALNTSTLSEAAARRAIAETAALTGLPTDDPYRFGGERLVDALRERLS